MKYNCNYKHHINNSLTTLYRYPKSSRYPEKSTPKPKPTPQILLHAYIKYENIWENFENQPEIPHRCVLFPHYEIHVIYQCCCCFGGGGSNRLNRHYVKPSATVTEPNSPSHSLQTLRFGIPFRAFHRYRSCNLRILAKLGETHSLLAPSLSRSPQFTKCPKRAQCAQSLKS